MQSSRCCLGLAPHSLAIRAGFVARQRIFSLRNFHGLWIGLHPFIHTAQVNSAIYPARDNQSSTNVNPSICCDLIIRALTCLNSIWSACMKWNIDCRSLNINDAFSCVFRLVIQGWRVRDQVGFVDPFVTAWYKLHRKLTHSLPLCHIYYFIILFLYSLLIIKVHSHQQ